MAEEDGRNEPGRGGCRGNERGSSETQAQPGRSSRTTLGDRRSNDGARLGGERTTGSRRHGDLSHLHGDLHRPEAAAGLRASHSAGGTDFAAHDDGRCSGHAGFAAERLQDHQYRRDDRRIYPGPRRRHQRNSWRTRAHDSHACFHSTHRRAREQSMSRFWTCPR